MVGVEVPVLEASLAPRAHFAPPATPPVDDGATATGLAPSNAELQALLVSRGLLEQAVIALPPAPPQVDVEPWLAGLRDR